MAKTHVKNPPGPKGLPFIGSMYRLVTDPLKFLQEVAHTYGNIAYLGTANGQRFHSVSDPDLIQYIFQNTGRKFLRSPTTEFLRPLLGNGLFMVEGDFWRRQRRLMQPAFHSRLLYVMIEIMTRAISEAIKECQKKAELGEPIEIGAEVSQVVVRIHLETLFSTEEYGETQSAGLALVKVSEYLYKRQFTPLKIPENWPTPHNREYQEALKSVHDIIDNAIREQYEDPVDKGDLLSILLLARDPDTGERMSREQVHDEALSMLVAGYDTTTNSLSWTFYLLAKNPGIAAKLHQEAETVLNGRVPSLQDYLKLEYADMIVNEGLRLYPPGWLNGRVTLQDEEMAGYFVPANSQVLMSPYVMHRHPDHWQNPEIFEPENFTKERSKNRHRYAFFPFGGGQRLCIGKALAIMQSKLVLAMASQAFEFELVSGHAYTPQPSIVLRATEGIPLVLKSRSNVHKENEDKSSYPKMEVAEQNKEKTNA